MSDLTEAQMDEYRTASNPGPDDKGRLRVDCMTDRGIAEETLLLLRAFHDALAEAGKNPMLKAIMPNLGKL